MLSHLVPLILAAAAAPAAHNAVAAPVPSHFDGAGGTLSRERIFIGPHERTFLAYAPARLPARPAVVLAFHGAGGSGARLRGFLGADLERLADAHGFVVLYADGLGGYWNDCRASAPYPAKRRNMDDVSFARGLVRWAGGKYGADPARVSAIGFSNGGHFALRLAFEAPDVVGAVAAIGASLPVAAEFDCDVQPALAAVMLINGTADPINPFGGGRASGLDGAALGTVRSAGRSARDLARLARHTGRAERAVILPRRADGTGVERTRWRRAGAADVVLITVHGGGHTIPGSSSAFPAAVGPVERAYSAVGEAVRFFGAAPSRRDGRDTAVKRR